MKVRKIQEKNILQLYKKKQKLKEKGITLIALVVTIIILLILAGVTLNMAMSGDGLFSRARNAADKYKKAQEDEAILIDEMTEVRRISTAEELQQLAAEVNEGNTFNGWTIILMNDIDLNEVCGEEKGSWTPIGKDEGHFFKGCFNGNNKTISNLWIEIDDSTNNGGEHEYYGLFGAMKNAEVVNLTITGNINDSKEDGSLQHIGGLSGIIRNSLIRKCEELCAYKC